MKPIRYLPHLLWVLLLLPFCGSAQNYNHIYDFPQVYRNSDHTSAVQIANGNIAQAGTIEYFNIPFSLHEIELGLVNPNTGTMIASPFLYSIPRMSLEAVDLIESSTNANWVVMVTNVYDTATQTMGMGVMKANAVTGAVAWSMRLGASAFTHGKAITRDGFGNYYVLGTVGACERDIYLVKITDVGTVVWQKWYIRNPEEDIEPIDILYDGNDLIIASNYHLVQYIPYCQTTQNGMIVSQVAPATGNMIASRHVFSILGSRDVDVRDIDLVNGNYVMVGELNFYTPPSQGFLIQYTPGLVPFGTFSQVYSNFANNITMTGVKPALPPNMIVSFDYRNTNGTSPGMTELTFAGAPITTSLYNVAGYRTSRGLISVNNRSIFVMKGECANIPGPYDLQLSLVSSRAPLGGPRPSICPTPITLTTNSNAMEMPFSFETETPDDVEDIVVFDTEISGSTVDCMGNPVGNFRLAATGVEEEGMTERELNIYPNPSNGIFKLELSEVAAERYQTAEIFNALGEVVHTFRIGNSLETIDLSGHVPGIYLLRLKTADGAVSEPQRIVLN